MKIPLRLEQLLKRDSTLHGQIETTLGRFEPMLRMSQHVFFPNYTDHGIQHIEDVFVAESSVIADSAWDVLTPEDAAAMIVAGLLHDVGMHMSKDGFITLIDANFQPPANGVLGDPAWPQLWSDFLAEARHFDARKLNRLFGDAQPVAMPTLDNLNERDFLLIGEFLRRHHHRLAHEIALRGMPGVTSTRVTISDDFSDDIRNLIGLIARSHGMPLRAAVRHLKHSPFSNTRSYRGFHAVFAMTVLRVADYLQIGAERAPEQVLQVRRIKSPDSLREWQVHQDVRDINSHQADPESLYINAEPTSVDVYHRLRQWLDGIQSELDASWAVLGEVYGRYEREGLNKLGLAIRRVTSNIDDIENFAERVSYHPRLANFRAAGSGLLPLLIRPLYSEKPEVGIRELMQNAVDAVLELRTYLDERTLPTPDLTEQEADVLISIERNAEGTWQIVVSDRGIGMHPDTICNYFLKVGASFRNSDVWRGTFLDGQCHSKVLRSGRFGIGALAAFLLGDSIHVTTRHVSAPKGKGVEFTASLETEAIELRYVNRPVGTTIRVRIPGKLAEELKATSKWDWYSLEDPCVVRKHSDVPTPIGQSCHYPQPLATLPTEWRRTPVAGYRDVQWKSSAEGLAVNGINVLGIHPPFSLFQERDIPNFPLYVHPFTLSVFDADGLFPLTLTRDRLQSRHPPFGKAIEHDFLCELLAHLLVHGPSTLPQGNGNTWIDAITRFGHLDFMVNHSGHWYGPVGCLGTSDGFGLAEAWTLKHASIERLLLLPLSDSCDNKIAALSLDTPHHAFVVVKHANDVSMHVSLPPAASWEEFVLRPDHRKVANQMPSLSTYTTGRRAIIPRESEAEVDSFRKKHAHLEYSVPPPQRREELDADWFLMSNGVCSDEMAYEERLLGARAAAREDKHDWMFGQWFFETADIDGVPSRLMQLWIDVIKQPLIPYDIHERRKQLKSAYEVLMPFVTLCARNAQRSREGS